MLKSRNFQIIGATVLIIVATLVTISANRPSAASTIDAAAYPDFAARHPGLKNQSIEKALGSDYYQRQAGLGNMTAPEKVDLSWPPRPDFSILSQNVVIPVTGDQASSDFYARHPELNLRAATVADLSDYAMRHPKLNMSGSAAADLSDYSLRHPELFQSTGAADTSDYFLRH